MKVELMLVGDELLTGQLDPYPAELMQAIRSRGSLITRVTILMDDIGAIAEELSSAIERRPDLILIAGGLGPTIDDVTRHALASFLKRKLSVNEDALSWLREAYHTRHGEELSADSPTTLMAMVPEGMEALRNPVGMACGIRAKVGGTMIICLPGFPKEMRSMFHLYVLPILNDEGIFEKEVRVMLGETSLEPIFQLIAKQFEVRLSSLPRENWRQEGGNTVVIKGRKEEVERACTYFMEMLKNRT
ncbi:MAG: molybdopterin-binding protein [Methanomassiliicoccales archaeon]